MKLEDSKSKITSKINTSKSRLKGKLYVNKKYGRKYVNSKKSLPNKQSIKKYNNKNKKVKDVRFNNTINAIKDNVSESAEQDIGIQAYIDTLNKSDKVINVASIPFKSVKTIKNINKTIHDSKHINSITDTKKFYKKFKAIKGNQKVVKASFKDSSNKIRPKPSGKINKKYLLKKGGIKLQKDSTTLSVNTKNRIVDNLRDSDGSSGIQAYLQTDKNIRRGLDIVDSTKKVITSTTKATKYSREVLHGSRNYIKERISNNKSKRYQNIKKNISKTNKIKTGSKKIKSKNNAILLKNAKKRIAHKHIYGRKATSILKGIIVGVGKFAKTTIVLTNPYILIGSILVVLMIIILTSISGIVGSVLSQNYFITDDNIALMYKERIELLDTELIEEIEELKNDNKYDSSKIIYIGDKSGIYTNFQEIFAIASVKFEQDLSFSKKEEDFIEDIYEKIYDIKISKEKYTVTRNGEDIDKTRKIITVYTYDMESIMNKTKLDEEQRSWSRRLVSNFSEQFPEYAHQYGELTQDEIKDLIVNAPRFSDKKQQKLYDTALSIVGKVKYFWGGKSSAGWNNEWGESTLVTSPGSDTTDTYKPYGLDCSGYVDWVYKTSGIGKMLSGGGTAYQWGKSYPINSDELQVGDLAFLQMPNSSGINHVGIYIGKDDENNNLYAHCQWGTGVTVNGYKGFKYFRRVVRFD
ncbi:C40 family peptidase [Sedimentibacter sp. MB31-C6]|uniref:C40 family peptidase n=1 Tax=Sedimentibacter sp. MB31-C6 TaxID=3109366 RepID=UPI002DDDA581|nr:NlpC/P60 family protein [Sedimentibacter sp. MB36-C1]WSI05112.1 NlpC/P60 family protein [Sedimentibacter sp. MB36-C1]